ncbi:MAG: BatA domain-containing protein [Victivallales bacterium]|nr:BatA domain-containing protein [Victivallales bacterium]
MPIFLANPFLWFSLVALVPIALHLLHRHRPTPMKFAAVRFLREALAQSRRARRVTQAITLLLRVLLVLLLALAFARPMVRFSHFLPGNQRTLMIVLDATASMQAQEGGVTLFDSARQWAMELLDGLEEGDRCALLAPGLAEPQVIFPPVSDLGAVRNALLGLNAGYATAGLAASLEAVFLLTDTLRGAEIHLFSDFQKSAWSAEDAKRILARVQKDGMALFWNRLARRTKADAGILTADFRPAVLQGDSGTTLRLAACREEAYGGAPSVRVEGEGTELTQGVPEFTSDAAGELSLPIKPSGDAPQFCGVVSLPGDAYPLNDRRWFSLPRVQGVPVLVVNGTAERDGFFLARALQPGGRGVAAVRPEIIDWSGFLSADATAYPLVFLCNPPAWNEAVTARLRRLLATGCTIGIFPGDAGGFTMESLHQLEPLRGLNVTPVIYPEAKPVILQPGSRQETLVRRLENILPQPWRFTTRRMLELRMSPEVSAALLESGEGGAFALSVPAENGRILLFGAGANRDWGDWPVSPLFLIVVQELAREVGAQGGALETVCGESVRLPWAGEELNVSGQMTSPDSEVRQVTLARQRIGEPMSIADLALPGLYSLEAAGRQIRFAVNLPRGECELNYLSREELVSSLPGVPVAYSEDASALRHQLENLRLGSPLWPVLLVLALLLVAAEVLFANWRSVRQEHASTPDSSREGRSR